MTITHIVSFKYHASTTPEEKDEIQRRIFLLPSTCLHPDTGRPYFVDAQGGVNTSPEGFGKDFDHAFVLLFQSQADLDYYLETDPVHDEFKVFVKPFVDDLFVFDFPSTWKGYDSPAQSTQTQTQTQAQAQPQPQPQPKAQPQPQPQARQRAKWWQKVKSLL
ncbi:uncharacterized protein PFL1_05396 [Pseudozyma flocculosa PF-1]|uniref:Stress-response A/B barrel domain-containing protein n=2 Tax=Pseudozyma flocculosa TaxID=84751 RepID=A0A5C3FA29_9BASI|nr:uncharacterized protein PFL1_05396 [Pseudozyma flocculosa PF-1]EPQ27114.1 hypothetical protein PFL1_05396 [Pseudozyma flocculosa PF-1]SPO41318.1 uncharacterized protein PSFLO_06800 [Pseudozyma flocculosa]